MKRILSIVLVLVFPVVMICSAMAAALTDAVSRGDMDAVRAIVKKGGKINAKGEGGDPPLHGSIIYEH